MCGPRTDSFPKSSLSVEIQTKETNSQEIIFAGANDLVIAESRPSLHPDFLISASTSALIISLGQKLRMDISKAKIITEKLEPKYQGF